MHFIGTSWPLSCRHWLLACHFSAGTPFEAQLDVPQASVCEVEHTDTSDRPYQEKLFDVSVDFTYSEALNLHVQLVDNLDND